MNGLEARFRLERPGFSLESELSAPDRGVTGLFGPSGSGKTTLLRCLAGLERPRGLLRLGEETWQDDARRIFVPPHRRAIGYVFQEARLFPHLTVAGNLEFGRRRLPPSRRTPIEPVVELLGLAALLTRLPHRLSGGEKQRVAIGRALLTAPRLLLMDEPLSAVDSARKGEIMPYLQRLHDELAIPVVYVGHNLDEIIRLADRLVYLDEGRVRAAGPTPEMLGRLDLPMAYGDDAAVAVDTVVASHDEAFGLTHLDFRGGRFHVPRLPLGAGKPARVRVLARDISLTLKRPSDTSILNIIPATVEAIADKGPTQVLVRLDAEGTPLLARITRKSCALLRLAPGAKVFAQVKSAALAD